MSRAWKIEEVTRVDENMLMLQEIDDELLLLG
jgi:hypothetical protein